MGIKAPEGYLFCNGKTYKISDYQNLAEQIKNNFGNYNYFGGDGTTTFAVPNLQGEFLRGYSISSDKSVTTGVSTENVGKHQDATKNVYLGINQNATDIWVQTLEKNTNDDTNLTPNGFDLLYYKTNTTGRCWRQFGTFDGTGLAYYSSRPTNTAVLYCIKY